MSVVMPRDERTVSVVRRSALVHGLEWILRTATVAWRHSIVGSATRSGAALIKEQSVAGRARLAGGVMTVASTTALTLQRFASRPAPLVWVVPAAFLVVGLCLVAASRERPARRRG